MDNNTEKPAFDMNSIPTPAPIMVGHCQACNKRWELSDDHTKAAFDGKAAKCPFCGSFQIREAIQIGKITPELSVPTLNNVEPVSEIKIVRKRSVRWKYSIRNTLLFGLQWGSDFTTDTAFVSFHLLGFQVRYLHWLERAAENESLVARFDKYLSMQPVAEAVDEDED